jgi:hypothetical protein
MKLRLLGAGGVACLWAGLGVQAVVAQESSGTIAFKGEAKRDPFIPLITSTGYLLNLEPEKNASLNLEGIMFDPKGDSIAIVNGEIVRVGDEVNGAVVVRIEPDRVSILKENKTSDLALRREE